MTVQELSKHLNELLRVGEISDKSLNGLQVENSGRLTCVGLAVDASLEAFQQAQARGVDLLIVHHGLFWGAPLAITGATYQRIKTLMDADMALYAAHLPLDMHPELGNNAQMEPVLGWPVTGDFGDYHGEVIGKRVEFDTPQKFDAIVQHVSDKLNCAPHVWDFGKKVVKRLGYVSGGAISMLDQAITAGLDVYITGEPAHASYWTAKEAGINVIMAGHYATETLGVTALGQHLEKTFGLKTVFIDLPTRL